MIVHDFADIFLEGAKCANYLGKARRGGRWWAARVSEVLFASFVVSFFITRLGIYPGHILSSYIFEGPEIHPTWWWSWPGTYFFLILLCSLQVLHIFWSYLVVKMVYRLFTTGTDKDERSDDEEEFEDDEAPAPIAHKKSKSSVNEQKMKAKHVETENQPRLRSQRNAGR